MNKKGFTLIELLIVIAIIGIIAAIAIPNMLMALQKSRQKGSMLGMHNIATGLEGAKADFGEQYVADRVVALTALVALNGTDATSNWLVPVHLSVQPNTDRWGNHYNYTTGGNQADPAVWHVYQLGCLGKDGIANTGNAPAAGASVLSAFPLAAAPVGPMEFNMMALEHFNCDMIFIDGMGIQVPSTGAEN